MRDLVDQGHGWLALNHGLAVHLLDGRALVRDPFARNNLQSLRDVRGVQTPVSLQETDGDISIALVTPVEFDGTCGGFTDAGRNANVGAMSSARTCSSERPRATPTRCTRNKALAGLMSGPSRSPSGHRGLHLR